MKIQMSLHVQYPLAMEIGGECKLPPKFTLKEDVYYNLHNLHFILHDNIL